MLTNSTIRLNVSKILLKNTQVLAGPNLDEKNICLLEASPYHGILINFGLLQTFSKV